MLFEYWKRTYTWHKTRKLSNFEFLDMSAWEICGLMRTYINDWIVDYEGDNDFMNKFRSHLPKQYYGAEFELLLYNILRKRGWGVEKHPDLGSRKHLDFKVDVPGQLDLLFECTLAGDSFENISDATQKEVVEDIIDSLEYYPYYINVTYNKISPNSLSRKRLIKFFGEKRKKSEGIENEQLIHLPDSFQDNGWELDFTMVRKPDNKPIGRRSLGYLVNRARTINTSKPLITALNDKKPSKYGQIAAPYIICVNTSDRFASDNCYYEALFGQYGPLPVMSDHGSREGFFLGQLTNNTRVAAVLFFRNFRLHSIDAAECSVWHNPFAKFPLPPNLLPFSEYIFKLNGNLIETQIVKKDVDFHSLLGIEKPFYLAAKEAVPDE
jgi:hypothetical protein